MTQVNNFCFRMVNGIVTCGPCPLDAPFGNGKVCHNRNYSTKNQTLHHTFQYQPYNPRYFSSYVIYKYTHTHTHNFHCFVITLISTAYPERSLMPFFHFSKHKIGSCYKERDGISGSSCYPGVQCHNVAGGLYHFCERCPRGKVGDGIDCRPDHCATNPCFPGAECYNFRERFVKLLYHSLASNFFR